MGLSHICFYAGPFLFANALHRSPFLFFVSKRCLAVIIKVRISMYHHRRNGRTIPALFAQVVTQHPDKPALIYEATGEVRSHQE